MWTTTMNDTTRLTLELRELVDNVDNPVDIWDFDYPSFYTGDDKKTFERKVIDHYYFRQIGQETPGRFLHCFRSRIREIMPYYIKMYESVKLMDDLENPFDNVDVVETFEEESMGQSTGQSSGADNRSITEDREHRFSNTPQGSIENLDDYMTEAYMDDTNNRETLETSGESSSQSSGTVKHTLTRKGNQGVNTYAHDIMEYRKSLIDVDMMIINNLQDLFLGVY